MESDNILSIQERDSIKLVETLNTFWITIKDKRRTSKVTPGILPTLPDEITQDTYPSESNPLEKVMEEVYNEIIPYVVNTSNPLFLGYVTPPALDITWLGNAIIAMLNQNVSFSALSPAGTAIEQFVVSILCKMVGYNSKSGGILVSGGSTANLQAMITARRMVIGEKIATGGNSEAHGSQRIYCSEQIHRSIHKAAILMGIGINNVIEIPCDENHQIMIEELRRKIQEDKDDGKVPIAIIGAAGTRTCGSFDDLKALSVIAEEYKIWFHVDGAFGAFLKIADNRPPQLDYLNLAHSITLDPHKLLFMPFDTGCLLVRDKQKLIDAFGTEGEYLEKFHAVGQDYCDYGIQLGRSMKSFNIWLALKYFGINMYQKEYERLIDLAREFKDLIKDETEFEVVGPSQSLIVCFRWNPNSQYVQGNSLNSTNENVRTTLIKEGFAYINGVSIEKTFALRICFANFNTTLDDLKRLLIEIKNITKRIT